MFRLKDFAKLLLIFVCILKCPAASGSPGSNLQERSSLVLQFARTNVQNAGSWRMTNGIALNHGINDVGKYWWPQILARLHDPEELEKHHPVVVKGPGKDTLNLSLDQLIHGLIHDAPNDRLDGSGDPSKGYLYYSPIGMCWVMKRYSSHIAPADLPEILTSVFDYAPSLSGLNLFTGEGGEIQTLAARSSALLICEVVLARGAGDPVSGPWYDQARRHAPELEAFILKRARVTYEMGSGAGESSIYLPYSIACWISLYELSDSPAIRRASHALLDLHASILALRHTSGIFGGAEHRGKLAQRPHRSGAAQLAWLWFGSNAPVHEIQRYWKVDGLQMVYPALSSYRPPGPTEALAAKRLPPAHFDQYHLEGKPSYLTFGSNATRAQSKGFFFISRNFTVGSLFNRPTGGWTGASNQEILWKMTGCNSLDSAWSGSGPLGRYPWRQVGQWKNVIIDMWHSPTNRLTLIEDARRAVLGDQNDQTSDVNAKDWASLWKRDFYQRFPSDKATPPKVTWHHLNITNAVPSVIFSTNFFNLKMDHEHQVIFTELDEVYLAIQSLNLKVPEVNQLLDGTEFQDRIREGEFGAIILEGGSKHLHGDFDDFQRRVISNLKYLRKDAHAGSVKYRTLFNDDIGFQYQSHGSYVEPDYDWGFGPTNQGGFVWMSSPPFRQPPWPSGMGHGRVPDLTVNGKSVSRHVSDQIYCGPNLCLHNNVMQVTDGFSCYVVDYRGSHPEFYQGKIQNGWKTRRYSSKQNSRTKSSAKTFSIAPLAGDEYGMCGIRNSKGAALQHIPE